MGQQARHRAPTRLQDSAVERPSPAGDGANAGAARGARPRPPSAARLAGGFGIGLLAALVGLAPWLVTGARLPLQNLWAEPTLPEAMPLSALPLSQYLTSGLLALMVAGGLAAGRALRRWARGGGVAAGAAAAGLLTVQLAATDQSFGLLEDGLRPGSASELYGSGLLGGVLASTALAVGVLLLVAARRRGAVALGIGLAAVPFAEWLLLWTVPPFEPSDVPVQLLLLIGWVPAVLVGLALAWYTAFGGAEGRPAATAETTAGARTGPARAALAAVWMVDLALLWVFPALLIGVEAALGSRVHLGDWAMMAQSARTAFSMELLAGWGPVLLAAVLGVVGAAALSRLPAGRLQAPGPDAPPPGKDGAR